MKVSGGFTLAIASVYDGCSNDLVGNLGLGLGGYVAEDMESPVWDFAFVSGVSESALWERSFLKPLSAVL